MNDFLIYSYFTIRVSPKLFYEFLNTFEFSILSGFYSLMTFFYKVNLQSYTYLIVERRNFQFSRIDLGLSIQEEMIGSCLDRL